MRIEERAVQAATLKVLADRIERDPGPALAAAAARLAPDGGRNDLERARAAARDILRPAARRLLADLLAEPPRPPRTRDEAGDGGAAGPTVVVAGRVVDEHDTELAQASVLATTPSGDLVAATTTGDDGRFSLELSSGAQIVLTAAAHGHTASAAAVTAEPGRRVRFVLPSPRAPLAVRVLTAEGDPVSDATVLALRADGSLAARTTTDGTGRARFEGLLTGSYTITVAHDPPAARRHRISLDGADEEVLVRLPAR